MAAKYKNPVSIVHQGTVITFANPNTSDDSQTDVYFNVLSLQASSVNDNLDWTGFSQVGFQTQLRPLGMSLITFDLNSHFKKTVASAPFVVATDQKYISIIQQSTSGTLYFSRFTLGISVSKLDKNVNEYSLNPAWEVRFQRSGKEDIPADDRDGQGYLGADKTPFIEPTFELCMTTDVRNGAFDVVLLPVMNTSLFTWQFTIYNSSTKAVDLFNFSADKTGLLSVEGKQISEKNQIAPDDSFLLQYKDAAGGTTAFDIKQPPATTVYMKQEKVLDQDGNTVSTKRAGRVMMAFAGTSGGTPGTAGIATVDAAISTQGQLAKIPSTLEASTVAAANYALKFNGLSYVELGVSSGANPLAIAGAYTMSFWIYPTSLETGECRQYIIGGDKTLSPKTLAPYVAIYGGSKIEVGFGNGTELISCQTVNNLITPNAWFQVEVIYAGQGSNPFAVRINKSEVLLTSCTTSAEPFGSPVSRVCDTASSFVGIVDDVSITVGATEACSFDFDTVDYTPIPPTTPNSTAGSLVTGSVYGAVLIASASPVAGDITGKLYFDENGLTIYAGVMDFVSTNSPPYLMEGSDGLIHLYVSDAAKDNIFAVAHYSTTTSRAVYDASWEAVDTTGNTETGMVLFTGRQSGTFLNEAEITVENSFNAEACDVAFNNTRSGKLESWKGVYRRITQLEAVINGDATGNPNDSRLQNGTAVFYDYQGLYPIVWAPSSNGASSTHFVFSGSYQSGLPLQSVTIEDNSRNKQGTVNVVISNRPGKWNPSVADSVLITQTWNAVPNGANQFVQTLNGVSSSYDYSAGGTMNVKAISLAARPSSSAQLSNWVVAYAKQPIVSISMAIADNAADDSLCDVKITCNGALYSLSGVARDQVKFASILNGLDTTYQYPADYVADVANNILVVTDGMTSYVYAQTSAAADMLAGSSLFALFFTGSQYSTDTAIPMAQTSAAILQGATTNTASGIQTLSGPSQIFAVTYDVLPANGHAGLIQNTTGTAPILQQGINGGWIHAPNHFSLDFNQAPANINYLAFDASRTSPSVDSLSISGDLTLEAWGKPMPSIQTSGLSRLLDYNVLGSANFPTNTFNYMMGFRNWQVPTFNEDTQVYSTVDLTKNGAPDVSIQAFVNLVSSTLGTPGYIVGLSTSGVVQDYFSLYSDATGNVLVKANGVEVATAYVGLGEWLCLGATLSWSGGTGTVKLYVNGQPVNSGTTVSFSVAEMGVFYAGGGVGDCAPMQINQASLWSYALNDGEMLNAANLDIMPNSPELLICWPLNEGTNALVAKNSTVFGAKYDGTYVNMVGTNWSRNGGIFSSPFACNGTQVLLAPYWGCRNWTFTSFVYRQGFSLNMAGLDYANCGKNASLNVSQQASFEAWVKPSTLGYARQTILAKDGSYEIGFFSDGTVYINMLLAYGSTNRWVSATSTTKLAANQTSYITATFLTAGLGTTYDPSHPDQIGTLHYKVEIYLYVNGIQCGSFTENTFTEQVSIATSSKNFYIGRTSEGSFYLNGQVGEVRYWSRALEASEIAQANFSHMPPSNSESLVSYWRFSEMKGKTAYDQKDQNNATLNSNQLWKFFPEISVSSLYTNGYPAAVQLLSPADVGGWGDQPQFTVGGYLSGEKPADKFKGTLDELRIWDIQLTPEQITDNMGRSLTGKESGLKGYWSFNDGSGLDVYDQTGRGNNGSFYPYSLAGSPQWVASDVPVGNEAAFVYNCLNGTRSVYDVPITGRPCVVEYGDIQTDAYASVFSVQKRCYAYVDAASGNDTLYAGYKVGDLDTIYVGQIQTKPTIIGFIEGGPPIPSENQTYPYWDSSFYERSDYDSASSFSLKESDEVTYSFTTTNNESVGFELNLKGGYAAEGEVGTSVGIGAEADVKAANMEASGGLSTKIDYSSGSSNEITFDFGVTNNKATSLTPPGNWENPDNILNPTVGLRFITQNNGLALVKSATADLYMSCIKGTNTPVKYSLVPNTEIPVDVNLIDFPIDPKYIKNGTLDGKVGLKNDPDYPGADTKRGSYFNPVEAYAIKRQIERTEKQMEAYYQQFNTSGMSIDEFKDQIGNNPSFDWAKKLSKRNIVNTYVWTASGGLYEEQKTVSDHYTEVYSGTSSFTAGLGVYAAGKVASVAGGFSIEFDAMVSGTIEKTTSRTKNSSYSFEIQCQINPDNKLVAPVIDMSSGKPILNGFNPELAPGKVNGYRFMSFYLQPSEENFAALTTAIDPVWLAQSQDANAIALNQASMNENGCWRVLYRTTYVNRIPAKFQPVNAETRAPEIKAPANEANNTWIIQLVSKIAGANPTPAEIGAAITTVMGTSAASPGILGTLIPWWGNFLAMAAIFGTDEYLEIRVLREDMLKYMVEKYEAEAAGHR